MDILNNVLLGFRIGLEATNLTYCFLGVLVGTLVGVLPGIGPLAAMSLLIPVTLRVPPLSGIIMLAGIYYGAMYGGSTTSILINIPGETGSVVTCLDGYKMARKGRAGPALGIAAFGSLIGGTIGIFLLMVIALPLAQFALRFGPPEYFSLMMLGLILSVYLGRGRMSKSFAMMAVGIFLSCIGLDIIKGQTRFTLGIVALSDGLDIVPLTIGLFGISEIFVNLEGSLKQEVFNTKIKNLLPTLKDWADSIWAIIRGTIIGFSVGILPGGGAIIGSFASYAVEKRLSKYPEKFGTGVIEGVAGPETANNAGTMGAFVPLFGFGIPCNPVTALLLAAMIIHGIQPGPLLLTKSPDVFWGVMASMYIGNIMLLVLNLPLIGIWVQILRIPYPILFPLIIVFCIIGSYTVHNNIFDVGISIFFGVIGYFMKKFGYEAAPLILAFVLGPLMEKSFRQSLILSDGSVSIFVTRPISFSLFAIAMGVLVLSLIPVFKKGKRKVDEVLKQIED